MPESRASPRGVEPRVPFGIPAIDEMLEGGLMPHRPYLIVGPSGTGKTTLALQFLREGIRRGEPGLYVTVEDPPNEVRADHRALGAEVDRIDVFDAIPDVMRYEHIPFKDISSVRDVIPFGRVPPEIRKTPEFTSVEVTISALEQLLRTEVQRRGYVRMVIDSLTALQYFCMKGIEPMSGAQAFLRFLSNLRTTSLLTVESPLEDVESAERSLARGEIRLFRWELEGTTVRAIGVEKFRGSSHDVRLHPYRIGPGGLDINLDLTISRDTRRIVEPAFSVVIPTLVESALGEVVESPAGRLGSLAEEVRDLVTLGVDVSRVRTEVAAALDAAENGRSGDLTAHVARVSTLTISLAESLLQAPPTERALDKSQREAFQRIVQRADAVRGGLPPTRLPERGQLSEQLGSVLSLLPPPGPGETGPRAPGAPAPPEVPAVAAPPAAEPSAAPSLAGPAEPLSEPRQAAAPVEPAPVAEPRPAVTPAETAPAAPPGPPAPSATEAAVPPPPPPDERGSPSSAPPPPAPSPKAGRPTVSVPPPLAAPPPGEHPLVDGEPMPAAGVHGSHRPSVRARAAGVTAPRAGAGGRANEPPAPPAGTTSGPSARAHLAADRVPVSEAGAPSALRREIPVRALTEPPPLPTLFKTTTREPSPSGPAAHTGAGLPAGPAAPARTGRSSRSTPSVSGPAPAPRRKRAPGGRRAAPPPATGTIEPAGAVVQGTPSDERPAAAPKRRAPRKRRAPPVVAAMVETPAPNDSGSSAPDDPGGSTGSETSTPEPPTPAPAAPSPPAENAP